MKSGRHISIITTDSEEPVSGLCSQILSRIEKNRSVLSVVFFFDSNDRASFLETERSVKEECRRYFGDKVPALTCVAQKPLGASLAAEVMYASKDCETEYHDGYVVFREAGREELVTGGVRFPEAGDTGRQAAKVFERIKEILNAEGFPIGGIYRQWNYIQGITNVSGGVQNYQLFNDARSAFYSLAEWPGGYPAATGIGCSEGGVAVSILAVKDPSLRGKPIDNPLQVPAHKYSGKVLASGRESVRTTPKFERARLVDGTVYISGTAAIKGEDSSLASDPAVQAASVVEVVESLVAPENILHNCKIFTYNSLRVYIKRPEDAAAIIPVLRESWKDVSMHFLQADICRPVLLLEIEGTGQIGRFLECCCTDAGEAVEAEAGGASRVELCEDLPCGGVTPSEANIRETLASVNIPVNVLVRARGGDFVYSEEEVRAMEDSISLCRSLGVNGVVIGALKEDGSVDMDAMRRLVRAAEGMEITFHRAFDECSDPYKALEDIISLGCDRLLTAGHASNVNEGSEMLAELHEKSDGRIIIMAGSGVRPSNIESLEKATGISEFHSSSHGPDGRTSRDTVAEMVRYSIS